MFTIYPIDITVPIGVIDVLKEKMPTSYKLKKNNCVILLIFQT